MDRLPGEIHARIHDFFDDAALQRSPMARVSRQWQIVVERQTFRRIHLKSTDLADFERIVKGYRRQSLKVLEYTVVLPGYDDEASGRFESDPDRLINDEVFTAALDGLFRILSSWDNCADGSIHLEVMPAFSPSDVDPLAEDLKTLDSEGPSLTDLRYRRFQYSYLHLLRPTELPEVRSVGSFGLNPQQGRQRAFAYRVAVDITAKLPNLHDGYWYMREDELAFPALRRTNRFDLARVFHDILPAASKLQSLDIDMVQYIIWDPHWVPADLTSDDSSLDPLCSAIRETTAQIKSLRTLCLTGCFDASLFWPGPGSATVLPFWQNLTCLDIQFYTARPSAGWYFRDPSSARDFPPVFLYSNVEMPPGYGHREGDSIEIKEQPNADSADILHVTARHTTSLDAVPDDDSLIPLIEAFGRACSQIPVLNVAALFSKLPMRRDHFKDITTWGVWFLAPGATPLELPEYFDPLYFEDGPARRLLWDVKEWRPPPDLQRLFQNIGRERYGNELVEEFVDNWAAAQDPDRQGAKTASIL